MFSTCFISLYVQYLNTLYVLFGISDNQWCLLPLLGIDSYHINNCEINGAHRFILQFLADCRSLKLCLQYV